MKIDTTGVTADRGHRLPPDVPMPLLARLKAVKEFHTGIERIRDAGGPVTMVRLGPSRFVPTFAIVTSPQGAHDVLAASDALDKEMVIQVENRIFGDNLFNMNHARWLGRRRAIQPVFTKKHVGEYAAGMAAAADRAARELVEAGEVDLDVEMRRLALGVITSSVFGLDAGDRARELSPAIVRMLEWNTKRGLRPVRAPRWMPTPARRRLRRAMAQVHGFIDEAIDAAADPGHRADLIRQLQQAIDPTTGRPLTRQQIRDELIVFFLAGHDTTATTLAYTLWALGRDAELQDRVAAEVAALGDRELTVPDVDNLPLTVQVLHEALRLCPPAAAIGRLAMQDVTVDGYRIPAGTNVVVGCYALHRDPELWDEPLRFDPERFNPERSAGRSRWQYLPFGAGPRSCIGDHFAMLEATLAIASIVRAARVDSRHDDFPFAIPFTLCAAEPVLARVTHRASTVATQGNQP